MVTHTDSLPTEAFLLEQDTYNFSCLETLHPRILPSHSQGCKHVSPIGRNILWISEEAQFTSDLLQCVARPMRCLGDALLLYKPSAESMPVLRTYFRHTVFGFVENFLPPGELLEVLADDRGSDLVIGGIVDYSSKNLTLWRGSLESLTVPFTAFAPSGQGVVPDFAHFRVIDYGQTIQLGAYEAATDSLLYDFDPEYRRRIAKERRASDQSFGAALRRLRKQRGLRREDFAPDLSAKTLARIERGEVLPHDLRDHTWKILTEKLGVEREEIETF